MKPLPHCFGKMTWILKYSSGIEPRTSICNCEHNSLKCKLLTRLNDRKKLNEVHDPEGN